VREPDLSRCAIILSRADEGGNVGSVCRAMKTMGFGRLVLAGCPDYDEFVVRMMSVHAFDVYEQALRVPDLETALGATSLSAGFTRRRGERRKSFSLSVDEFAAMVVDRLGLAAAYFADPSPVPGRDESKPAQKETGDAAAPQNGGTIALVFGNERTGLTGEELALCSLAVHIPTSDEFSSLNLSQAVQIAAWEIRRAFLIAESGTRVALTAEHDASAGFRRAGGGFEAASRDEVGAAIGRVARRLEALGFFKLNDGIKLREFLRDLSERAALSPAELRYFESFLQKTASLAAKLED